MTSERIHVFARAIDPEAWAQRDDRKWSYYRRRRSVSLKAAERVAAMLLERAA